MKFAAADVGNGHLIEGYEPGRILIDGHGFTNGLIISPERVVTGWGPASAEDLSAEHIEALVELDPQVIIVGTGIHQVFPEPRICVAALQRGLGVEFMDTGAACRTYNILMAEDRKVTAGLIVG